MRKLVRGQFLQIQIAGDTVFTSFFPHSLLSLITRP